MFTLPKVLAKINQFGNFDEVLRQIPDPRSRCHYPLFALLKALLFGLILAQKSLNGLEAELRDNSVLRRICGLDKGPCAETFSRMLAALTVDALLPLHQFVVRRFEKLGWLESGGWLAVDGSVIGPARGDDRLPLAVFAALILPGKLFTLGQKSCACKKGEEPVARDLIEELLPELRRLGVRGILADAGHCDGNMLALAKRLGLEVVIRLKQEDFSVLREARAAFERAGSRPAGKTIMRFGSKRYAWEWWEYVAGAGLGNFQDPIRVIWLRQTRLNAKNQAKGAPEEHWCLTLTPVTERGAVEVLKLMRARWHEEVGLFRQAKQVFRLRKSCPKRGREVWWSLGTLAKVLTEWLREELGAKEVSLEQFQIWLLSTFR